MTAAQLAYNDMEALPAYLRTINVVLFVISLVLWIIFFVVTFKPFMLNSLKVRPLPAQLCCCEMLLGSSPPGKALVYANSMLTSRLLAAAQ